MEGRVEIIYALKDVTLYPYVFYIVIIINFMEYQTRWQFTYSKYGENVHTSIQLTTC